MKLKIKMSKLFKEGIGFRKVGDDKYMLDVTAKEIPGQGFSCDLKFEDENNEKYAIISNLGLGNIILILSKFEDENDLELEIK